MTSLFVVLTGRSLLSWSTGSRAAPPLTFTPSRAVYISSAPSPRVSFFLHSDCPSCALSNHYDKKKSSPLCWGMLGRMLYFGSHVHIKSSVNREVQVWCRWKFVAKKAGSRNKWMWLSDWIVFNPISAIFKPYNEGAGRVKTQRVAKFMYRISRNFSEDLILALLASLFSSLKLCITN